MHVHLCAFIQGIIGRAMSNKPTADGPTFSTSPWAETVSTWCKTDPTFGHQLRTFLPPPPLHASEPFCPEPRTSKTKLVHNWEALYPLICLPCFALFGHLVPTMSLLLTPEPRGARLCAAIPLLQLRIEERVPQVVRDGLHLIHAS